MRDRHGLELVKVPLLADAEAQLGAFAARISERTRLLAISHITTETAFRLPVEQLCALARERGILTFVDLAHSVGLFPIDLAGLGCDYAGILSYKWMYAPYAAGRAEAWPRAEVRRSATHFERGPAEPTLGIARSIGNAEESSWPFLPGSCFIKNFFDLYDVLITSILNVYARTTGAGRNMHKNMPGRYIFNSLYEFAMVSQELLYLFDRGKPFTARQPLLGNYGLRKHTA